MVEAGAVLGLRTQDGRRPRVALVGGSRASAMVAGVLIEQFGCASLPARRGGDVLALLASREPIDLVVVDVTGNDDALSTSELIGTLGAGQPPVVALAEANATPRRAFRFARYAGTVAKPYSPRELYGAMRNALEGAATAAAGTA
jgi:CheY-like chemotaxis protein